MALKHKITFTSFSFKLLKYFATERFKKDTNTNETLKQFFSIAIIKISFWKYNCTYI